MLSPRYLALALVLATGVGSRAAQGDPPKEPPAAPVRQVWTDLRERETDDAYYVLFFRRSGGPLGLGHAFVGLAKEDADARQSQMRAMGLYSRDGAIQFFGEVPAMVVDEVRAGSLRKVTDQLTCRVDRAAYDAATRVVKSWAESTAAKPLDPKVEGYQLVLQDCVTFTAEVARSIGLAVPSRWRTMLPYDLIDTLIDIAEANPRKPMPAVPPPVAPSSPARPGASTAPTAPSALPAEYPEHYGVYGERGGRWVELRAGAPIRETEVDAGSRLLVFHRAGAFGPTTAEFRLRRSRYVRYRVVGNGWDLNDTTLYKTLSDPQVSVRDQWSDAAGTDVAVRTKPAPGRPEMTIVEPTEPLGPGVYSLRSLKVGLGVALKDLSAALVAGHEPAFDEVYANGFETFLPTGTLRPASFVDGAALANRWTMPPDPRTGYREAAGLPPASGATAPESADRPGTEAAPEPTRTAAKTARQIVDSLSAQVEDKTPFEVWHQEFPASYDDVWKAVVAAGAELKLDLAASEPQAGIYASKRNQTSLGRRVVVEEQYLVGLVRLDNGQVDVAVRVRRLEYMPSGRMEANRRRSDGAAQAFLGRVWAIVGPR